jgi:hypothetical protein
MRFRLYPNHAQEARMLKMIEVGRWLWNDALAYRSHRWEQNRQSTSYNLQAWILSGKRANNPNYAILYSQSGQDMPELKPVEATPLLLQTTGATSVAIEAGTTRSDLTQEGLESHGISHEWTSHTNGAESL